MNKVNKRPTSPRVGASRAKKEKIVAELSDKVSRAKGLVFTNYQGLTHVQLEKLKRTLREANAELVVTKNTLLKLSLLNSKLEYRNSKQFQNSNDKNSKHLGVSDFARSTSSGRPERESKDGFRISDFEGPTATLFLYADPIEPLRQLAKAIKELSLPTVKFGIIDKQTLTSEQVLTLAALPPYNVLIGELLFQMKASLFRLHRALGWNIQKLVLTLKAVETKKH